MLTVASALAILVTVIGSLTAAHFHRPTGPFIVTLAAAVFFLSALWRNE
jgi:ABC-type Mn2+/Zn2+ transport system permease subunit